MNILRQVSFERLNRRKDKSCTLTFNTQLEESSRGLMEMDELLNDSGTLYFKSSGNLTEQEIKALDVSEIQIEGKSKSQRFRNVIYVYHNQLKDSGDTDKDFNSFYSEEMEKLINHYKSKLK